RHYLATAGTQLGANPDIAVTWVARGHVQNRLHQFGRGLVRHARFAARLRRQPFQPALVESALDFVKPAAADAGALASLADVFQLARQLQYVEALGDN